jgi:drug/metabolite transporter (DMT)-like permease
MKSMYKNIQYSFSNIRVYIILIFIVAIWGGAFIAIKYLLNFITPAQIVKLRYIPTAVIFIAILFFKNKDEMIRIIKQHPFRVGIISFTGVICYNLSLAIGEVKLSAGTAALIVNLSPIFNLIFAVIFLNERFSWANLAGLILSMTGLFIIVRFGSEEKLELGYYLYALITFLAPLSWAIYTVASQPLSKKFDAVSVTGLSIVLGTLPLIFLLNGDDIRAGINLSMMGWIALLFLIFGCTIFGFSGWVWTLKKLPTTRVASFLYLVPIFSLLFGYVLLGEKLTSGIIVGSFILLSGVYVVNKSEEKK